MKRRLFAFAANGTICGTQSTRMTARCRAGATLKLPAVLSQGASDLRHVTRLIVTDKRRSDIVAKSGPVSNIAKVDILTIGVKCCAGRHDDERSRCKGSNLPVRPSDFSQPTASSENTFGSAVIASTRQSTSMLVLPRSARGTICQSSAVRVRRNWQVANRGHRSSR